MSEDFKDQKGECCNNGCKESCEPPKRRRGLTSVTLQWIAERFKKAELVKEQLAQGTYQIDTSKVAKALISAENE